MFAFAALAAFSFLIFRFRKSWATQKYAAVAVVGLLANVELSAKRTAQLGIVVSVLFLFWRFPARKKLKFGLQLTAGVLVMILLLGAIGNNPVRRTLDIRPLDTTKSFHSSATHRKYCR